MPLESSTPPPDSSNFPAQPAAHPRPFSDAQILVIAAILSAAAFSNIFHGAWVYDDTKQICDNQLIQEPRFLTKALTSDVWAFHGEKGAAWSNYWRPLFMLWLIANYQLFGLWVVGWHLTTLLAHFAVVALVYFVLKALRLHPAVAAGAAWIFAVHPVHSESVAWVSGVTDPLLAIFLLSAYYFHLKSSILDASRPAHFHPEPAAWAFYLLACFCKESAVIFPAILFFTDWILLTHDGAPSRPAARLAALRALPFIAIAAVFMAMRFAVLRQLRMLAPNAPGLIGVLGSAPEILVFYLRQAFFPVILSPVSPLRPITNSNIGLYNFILPIGIILVLSRLFGPMIRRNPAYRLGLVWLLLPIALAFDIRVFLADQIVSNRYLYLSVLGAAVIVCTAILGIFKNASRLLPYAAGLLIAVALIPLTRDYNAVWSGEIALWERGVQVDPRSAHAFAQLGEAYRKAGRLDEAEANLIESIQIDPDLVVPNVVLGLVATAQGRYATAEERLKKVLAVHPDNPVAVENLADCYQKQARLDDAIKVFEDGIARMPWERPLYSKNIALLHAQANHPNQAIAVLESVRPLITDTTDPRLFESWYYLGELYRNENRPREAAESYDRFLSLSQSNPRADIQALRLRVQQFRASQ